MPTGPLKVIYSQSQRLIVEKIIVICVLLELLMLEHIPFTTVIYSIL